jgi:hypothetical protein
MMEKRHVAFCNCSSPDHLMVFEVCHWDEDQKELFIYYKMSHYARFLKRLWIAYKYVTKSDADRVDYTDIMVSDVETLKKLRDAIDEVVEFNSK